jgi:hypothetical protein
MRRFVNHQVGIAIELRQRDPGNGAEANAANWRVSTMCSAGQSRVSRKVHTRSSRHPHRTGPTRRCSRRSRGSTRSAHTTSSLQATRLRQCIRRGRTQNHLQNLRRRPCRPCRQRHRSLRFLHLPRYRRRRHTARTTTRPRSRSTRSSSCCSRTGPRDKPWPRTPCRRD